MADERDQKLRLVYPLALLIGVVWVATAVVLVTGGPPTGFEISSGPFALLCGYVFGLRVVTMRKDDA